MAVLNHNFFAVAVKQAQAYRDAVSKPLPVVTPLNQRERDIEHALDAVRMAACDFVTLANDSTPDEAASLHMRIEEVIVRLAEAANVAADRALGPRSLPKGAA